MQYKGNRAADAKSIVGLLARFFTRARFIRLFRDEHKSVHWIPDFLFSSLPKHFCLSLCWSCSVNQCNKRIISLIRVSAFRDVFAALRLCLCSHSLFLIHSAASFLLNWIYFTVIRIGWRLYAVYTVQFFLSSSRSFASFALFFSFA